MKSAIIALGMLLLGTLAVKAESPPEISAPTLLVEHAWSKPNYGPNGAAYFIIKNHGKKARHLTGAASPLSKRVELHTHKEEDGVMKMRKLKEPLTIAPGASLKFAPAGHHVMLFAMEKKLKAGETLPLTLHFKDGEKLAITAKVKKQEHRGSHH